MLQYIGVAWLCSRLLTLLRSTFLRSNLWCSTVDCSGLFLWYSTLDCRVLFWTLNNVSQVCMNRFLLAFTAVLGTGQTNSKCFFWSFILFCKSRSWKVHKTLKVVYLFSFCCVAHCFHIVLRYYSYLVVWAAGLNCCAAFCCFMLFFLVCFCVIMFICLHLTSLIYQLFCQDIHLFPSTYFCANFGIRQKF